MKMKDLCESERPREKMLSIGAGSLGNAELLAVLLRDGNRNESVLELSNRILASVDGRLAPLFNMSLEQLKQFHGVGPCKAACVAAAFELGRRFLQEESASDGEPVLSPYSVYELMIPQMKGLQHEECWVLWLNSRNCITARTRVNTGGMSSTVMDLRRITKMALERDAAGIFLVHNHPGGNPSPSEADIRQTEALRASLQAIGVRLADHVIVSDSSFYSFDASKILKPFKGQKPRSRP